MHGLNQRFSNARPWWFNISWILAVMLGGCADDNYTDLQAYVAEVKARQKGTVEPLPEVKTVEPFVLTTEDLRDPFLTDIKEEEPEEETSKLDSGIRPDSTRPREELEAYELDSLRMMGTVIQLGQTWGLVRAKDGTIHRVKVGNYMGKNYGKVINIKENQIELIEIISESPGTWRERKAALDLSEATGGKQ